MAEPTQHPSDSSVQVEAEAIILDRAAHRLNLESLRPRTETLASGAQVAIDGVSRDRKVFVEAYARQGKLKGGQLKKVSQDILKLHLLRRSRSLDVRTVIALASPEAEQSIQGWLRYAAETLHVELVVVDIPDDLRERIKAAQAKQIMVNVGEVADDVNVADDVSLPDHVTPQP